MRELRRKLLRTEQERDLLKRAAAFFVEPGVKSVLEVDLVGEASVGLEVRLGVAVQALDRVLGWSPTHSLDASTNDVIEHYRSGNTPL